MAPASDETWFKRSGLYRSLRHRDYAIFSAGSWVSAAGMWVQRVGFGVLTWELTHSPAWLGGIALAQALPSIFLVAFAGAIADRVDRVKLLAVTQVMSAVLGGILAWLVIADLITIWLLAGFAVLIGVANTLGLPARMTIAPTLVPRDDLSAALATNSVFFHSTSFIGPAIGGLLIAQFGIGSAFAANAASYVAMWVALLFINPLVNEHKAGGRGILSDVLDGFRYTVRHKGIGPAILLTTLVAFFARPLTDLLPGFVDVIFQRDPEIGVATFLSAFGVGGMVVSLWLANRGRIQGMTTIFIAASLVMAAATGVFALTPVYWVAVALMVVIGGVGTVSQSGAQMLVQQAVDGSMRARVLSLYTLNYRAAPALGALFMGWLSAAFGLQTPVIGGAVLCAIAALWLMRRRAVLVEELESIDEPEPDRAASAAGA